MRNVIGVECNVKFTDEYWKDLVNCVDKNGDKKIDFEEFMEMMKT